MKKAWHGGGGAGSQAISTFPRHRAHQAAVVRSGAKSRTVSRVRPVRDRTRAAHAARCKRGHRCQAGSMALRRCRWRPLFLLVDGLRRFCRRCIRRGLDVDALSHSGRDLQSRCGGGCGRVCRPDACLQQSRFKAERHSGEEQNAAGAMSEPEELRSGEQSKQKQRVVRIVPAMKD